MQIIWSICVKNFNLVRPAHQFFPQKCHFWSKDYDFFIPGQNFGIFASSIKGMDTFQFEMSMKWMFRIKNFRNVYWHGKTHSALHPGIPAARKWRRREGENITQKSKNVFFVLNKFKQGTNSARNGAKRAKTRLKG